MKVIGVMALGNFKRVRLEQVWESENFGSDQKLKDAITEREEKIWLDKVNTRRKLRTYKTLKNKLRLETFLHELSRDEYRQFVMLRGGTNFLRIERGRWESKNVNERACRVCMSEKGELEDEMHFMVICPMYERERVRMYEEIRKKCDIDLENIKDNAALLNSLIGQGVEEAKAIKVKKIVAAYIRKAHKIRNRYAGS